ncbi:hypothetical protein EVAR_68061_1 [Eumeta japonica]|uniref:Uncharacterized protein n=1 Tax=Eumeta variegata TaxID=151549 RepID=A0A4C1ZRM0_EUMVA|nr:hypothetical protein EVAR_68061_1 [Eumeta japonica]
MFTLADDPAGTNQRSAPFIRKARRDLYKPKCNRTIFVRRRPPAVTRHGRRSPGLVRRPDDISRARKRVPDPPIYQHPAQTAASAESEFATVAPFSVALRRSFQKCPQQYKRGVVTVDTYEVADVTQ